MKSYKNPEIYTIEVEAINGEKKILNARTMTGGDFTEIEKIANGKHKTPFENVSSQLAYVFGESKEWFLKNIHFSILNDILNDFTAKMGDPTKGQE